MPLPFAVRRVLRELGADIRDARRRRRIPMAVLAERALISRTTLSKVEKGDPGVSLGAYATVLFVLGFAERLRDVAAVEGDAVGLALGAAGPPPRARRWRAAQRWVSLGAEAAVLFVLGFAERLRDVAAVEGDAVGLALEDERLPQRVRGPRAPRPRAAAGGAP